MDICKPCFDNSNIYEHFTIIANYTIETGNPKYLEQYIKKYRKLLNKSHIEMANNIIFQLTEEKLEDMNINL